MPFKTADEEAIEANFIVDIQRIGVDLQKSLNKQLARDEPGFSFDKKRDGCKLEKGRKGGGSFQIFIESSESKNPKITFQILCEFYTGHKSIQVLIPVSHQEIYTKKEIERAKKSVMVKVLEGFKKHYSDD